MFKMCYLHPDRPAVDGLRVPCAPGGELGLCEECAEDPDVLKKTFAKYKAEHAKRIALYKRSGDPRN